MTLTKCDLYFADKAILIEGPTERILMPRIHRLVDEQLEDDKKLSKQYISIIEVGGAYAHRFYPLLDYLELRTLIITDIDSVKLNGSGKWIKCKHSEGARTSNAAIKNWFNRDNISPEELKQKTQAEKVIGHRCLTYQIPEATLTACARSFEDALVLANPTMFGLNAGDDWEEAAWNKAQDMPKTETALRYAIEVTNWEVPRYIKEGLRWLSEPPASILDSTAPDTPEPPEQPGVLVEVIAEHG
ncbi:MAG TPA: ATP-dependent endonuclease [Rhodocyclaceae bacterium]|nr:ATP-dependent endonuclease [Rhodocyclaceae bacterium]